MNVRSLACTLAALALLAVLPAAAQPVGFSIVQGLVSDDSTGQPLEGAHVIIAGSMQGTVTDAEGRYRLVNVPTGAHRLYVSMVGYESGVRDVLLREPRAYEYNFRIKPSILTLEEVTVTGETDPRWKERLQKFTRLFIGETPNAEQVSIVNPEVLDFDEKVGLFRAVASEPLVIENRALGYRITYFLKDFEASPTRTKYDGEPLFEEMTPSGPDEQAMWTGKRREAFMGSFRHFMLAVLADRVEEQGFHLYQRPLSGPQTQNVPLAGPAAGAGRFPLKANQLYRAGETPNEKVLDFHGYVEYVYEGELEDEAFLLWSKRGGRPKYQTSMLLLENGPTMVDYKGDTLDPYGVTFFGYLAFERVADEVPKEYRPR